MHHLAARLCRKGTKSHFCAARTYAIALSFAALERGGASAALSWHVARGCCAAGTANDSGVPRRTRSNHNALGRARQNRRSNHLAGALAHCKRASKRRATVRARVQRIQRAIASVRSTRLYRVSADLARRELHCDMNAARNVLKPGVAGPWSRFATQPPNAFTGRRRSGNLTARIAA